MQSGRQLSSLAYTTYKLKLSWLLYAAKYSQAINHVNMVLVPNVSETFSMSIIRCWLTSSLDDGARDSLQNAEY